MARVPWCRRLDEVRCLLDITHTISHSSSCLWQVYGLHQPSKQHPDCCSAYFNTMSLGRCVLQVWQADAEKVTFVAGGDIPSGSEVFNNYGDKMLGAQGLARLWLLQ